MLAWGNAPGFSKENLISAESAIQLRRGFSIPNIPLVEINTVPAEQFAVFLLKGARAMVLLLRLDVLHHGIQLTRTYRKSAITPLPEKTAIASVERFDPFRGGFLYLFDKLSLGNSSRHRRHNVNVIGNTSDVHEFGTEVAANCRKIRMHSWPDL